ncbi:MAG: HEAT repeat domain-containing protein [Deltaproteobacteria bacterium]|nr:HEAT repeat domain-containing protein [Deltaproteobacteria bacterium]
MLRHHLAPAVLAMALACGGRDLASPVPERRAAAVAALGSSRSDAGWDALLVAQVDPSALVRKAAAGALTARGGPLSVEGLGLLARDPDPEVAIAAVRGLAAQPQERRVQPLLLEAFWQAPSQARPELGAALLAVGGSAREAVELEARRLWERNARILSSGAGAERAGAAEELGRSGRREAVKLLLPLLGSGDPRMVAAAARGLGRAGDRQARVALEKLLDAPDAAVVEAAAEALGALGQPESADALARLSRSGPERLALRGVAALGELPGASEVGVGLCEVALRSAELEVAARAARAARLRDADCPEQPLAARIGRRGPDQLVALAVAAELRLPADRTRRLAERILPLVGSPAMDGATRAAAALALGRLGFAPATPALLQRAGDLRGRMAESRTRWFPAPPPGAAPAWVARAERGVGDAAELAAVAVALARLRAEGAEPLARALLADPVAALRLGGVEALDALGGAGLAATGPLLADPDRSVRFAAARALGRTGSPGVQLLADATLAAPPDDPEWQAVLARALSETGDARAVAPLAHLLDGLISAEAAAGLGRLGSRDGAAVLEQRLRRPGGIGRVEALDALAVLGGPGAGALPARDLLSERADVRAAAARAVGRLRYEAAAPWLEALRSDYAGEVRRAAIEALARLPSVRPAAR